MKIILVVCLSLAVVAVIEGRVTRVSSSAIASSGKGKTMTHTSGHASGDTVSSSAFASSGNAKTGSKIRLKACDNPALRERLGKICL